MCNLTNISKKKVAMGWKVVAVNEKDGKNYSLAMGFCYNDHDKIPVVKEQKRIGKHFRSDILDPIDWRSVFRSDMQGRTAIFTSSGAAAELASRIRRVYGYRVVVKLATIEDGLMDGSYYLDGYLQHQEVIAGRKLKFI